MAEDTRQPMMLPAELADDVRNVSIATGIPMVKLRAEAWRRYRPTCNARLKASASSINVDDIYKPKRSKNA